MARPNTATGGDFDTDWEQQQHDRGLGVADKVKPAKDTEPDDGGGSFPMEPEEPDEGNEFARKKKRGSVAYARPTTRLRNY